MTDKTGHQRQHKWRVYNCCIAIQFKYNDDTNHPTRFKFYPRYSQMCVIHFFFHCFSGDPMSWGSAMCMVVCKMTEAPMKDPVIADGNGGTSLPPISEQKPVPPLTLTKGKLRKSISNTRIGELVRSSNSLALSISCPDLQDKQQTEDKVPLKGPFAIICRYKVPLSAVSTSNVSPRLTRRSGSVRSIYSSLANCPATSNVDIKDMESVTTSASPKSSPGTQRHCPTLRSNGIVRREIRSMSLTPDVYNLTSKVQERINISPPPNENRKLSTVYQGDESKTQETNSVQTQNNSCKQSKPDNKLNRLQGRSQKLLRRRSISETGLQVATLRDKPIISISGPNKSSNRSQASGKSLKRRSYSESSLKNRSVPSEPQDDAGSEHSNSSTGSGDVNIPRGMDQELFSRCRQWVTAVELARRRNSGLEMDIAPTVHWTDWCCMHPIFYITFKCCYLHVSANIYIHVAFWVLPFCISYCI